MHKSATWTRPTTTPKLLRALGDLPLAERTARFGSTIVFVDEDGSLLTASGTCEGHIGF